MRALSNLSNSLPDVAVLARDVHVSGLCISLSAVIAANSPSKRLPVGAVSLFKQQKVPTSTRAQSKTSMGSPPNCSGPTNMDIEEPQFVRIVLLAFKESPVNGSPFGLSLFVPFLVVPPWALGRAKESPSGASPCQTVSLLSPVVLVRDVHDSRLVHGSVMQLPHAHFQSKRRPVLPNFPL